MTPETKQAIERLRTISDRSSSRPSTRMLSVSKAEADAIVAHITQLTEANRELVKAGDAILPHILGTVDNCECPSCAPIRAFRTALARHKPTP